MVTTTKLRLEDYTAEALAEHIAHMGRMVDNDTEIASALIGLIDRWDLREAFENKLARGIANDNRA